MTKNNELTNLSPKEKPPRIPKHYINKSVVIVRIRNEKTQEITQKRGVIYSLDLKDTKSITVYGGHQVIVLDTLIDDFEDYTIVSITEPWK